MQINVKRQGLGADPEERRIVREEEKATVGEGEHGGNGGGGEAETMVGRSLVSD